MSSTGRRRLALWNRGEEGSVGGRRWGGAPVTGPHCASPSALSLVQGGRVPPNMELSRASHTRSCRHLEYGERY